MHYFSAYQHIPLTDPIEKDVQYMLMPVYGAYLDLLRYYYPGGIFTRVNDLWGEPLFYIYTVKKGEALGQQGLQGVFSQAGRTVKKIVPAALTWKQLGLAWSGPFRVKLTGCLEAPRTLLYKMRLESAYPYAIKIDGKKTVWSGKQGIGVQSLTAGLHEIEITTQGDDQSGLVLSMDYDEKLAPVPARLVNPKPLFGHGLLGTYFNNGHFNGMPEFEMVDPVVDMQWCYQRTSSIGAVEWNGEIYADKAGSYTLGLDGVEAGSIMVDGLKFCSNAGDGDKCAGTRNLNRGWHLLQVRYDAEDPCASVHLWWIRPSYPYKVTVETAFLRPKLGEAGISASRFR
jgi:hypothetical protein